MGRFWKARQCHGEGLTLEVLTWGMIMNSHIGRSIDGDDD